MRKLPPSVHVRILDESRLFFDGGAVRVHFEGREGEFEVSANHAPIMSLLKNGTIVIEGASSGQRTADRELNAERRTLNAVRIPIERGVMKMEMNRVLVMVEVGS